MRGGPSAVDADAGADASDTGGGGGESSTSGVAPADRSLREDADLVEYGQSLGIDMVRDTDLHWVVEQAFNAPLPTGWTEHIDDEGRVYFFQEATNQSTWEHPMDSVYRELLGLIRKQREQEPQASQDRRGAYVHDHLKEVHQRALRALESWSGPYSSSEGEYYYNEELKMSWWECPVAVWEQELSTRHEVLCRCLLPEYLTMAADGSLNPVAGSAGLAGPELLQSLRLPLGLVSRRPDGDVPETPSSRSFHTARSACSARSQHRSSPQWSPGRPPPPDAAGGQLKVPGGSSQEGDSDDGALGFTFGTTDQVTPATVLASLQPGERPVSPRQA